VFNQNHNIHLERDEL